MTDPKGPPPLIVNFQQWSAIDATPIDFMLFAGLFALQLAADAWGTATLQSLQPDGVTYLPVFTASQNLYQELRLPAGQYQLTLDTVTGLTGQIAKIRANAI